MKMHVNRMFRIAAALLPLLAAGCSDPDEGPGKPLEITLSAQTLELEHSETGCLRFALTPWKDVYKRQGYLNHLMSRDYKWGKMTRKGFSQREEPVPVDRPKAPPPSPGGISGNDL